LNEKKEIDNKQDIQKTVKGFSLHEKDLLLTEATPLIQATNNNNLLEVQKLIKEGVDVNKDIGGYGGTSGLMPLMVAAQNANIKIMKELIHAGANVNERAWVDQPHAGKPVLWYAIDNGLPEAVNILIENGANPNAYTENPIIVEKRPQTNIRNLPLISAAINSHKSISIIKKLIVTGADVNQKGVVGDWTPLMVAAYRGYTDAVKELLKAGADPSLKNSQDSGWIWYRYGRTALDYAKEQGHKDIVQILQNQALSAR